MSEHLPCTTSSWLNGQIKFSVKAYMMENVSRPWLPGRHGKSVCM